MKLATWESKHGHFTIVVTGYPLCSDSAYIWRIYTGEIIFMVGSALTSDGAEAQAKEYIDSLSLFAC